MVSSCVCTPEYPSASMIEGRNVEYPYSITVTPSWPRESTQTFQSLRASRTWSHWTFSPPSSGVLSRSRRIRVSSFSRGVRYRAVSGSLARTRNAVTPSRIVGMPSMIINQRQALHPRMPSMWPIAYPRSPPQDPATAAAVKSRKMRSPSSRRR
ncbi:hypothetical protein VTN96DRAFT_7427 [Rasamsonia emersonii]